MSSIVPLELMKFRILSFSELQDQHDKDFWALETERLSSLSGLSMPSVGDPDEYLNFEKHIKQERRLRIDNRRLQHSDQSGITSCEFLTCKDDIRKLRVCHLGRDKDVDEMKKIEDEFGPEEVFRIPHLRLAPSELKMILADSITEHSNSDFTLHLGESHYPYLQHVHSEDSDVNISYFHMSNYSEDQDYKYLKQ